MRSKDKLPTDRYIFSCEGSVTERHLDCKFWEMLEAGINIDRLPEDISAKGIISLTLDEARRITNRK